LLFNAPLGGAPNFLQIFIWLDRGISKTYGPKKIFDAFFLPCPVVIEQALPMARKNGLSLPGSSQAAKLAQIAIFRKNNGDRLGIARYFRLELDSPAELPAKRC
jgi:hypothetical protein